MEPIETAGPAVCSQYSFSGGECQKMWWNGEENLNEMKINVRKIKGPEYKK